MKFTRISSGGGREIAEKKMKELIEHLRSGRMEHCSIIWTMLDRDKHESFFLFFAPTNWRMTVGHLLITAASYVLGGRPAVMQLAKVHEADEPSYSEGAGAEHRVH